MKTLVRMPVVGVVSNRARLVAGIEVEARAFRNADPTARHLRYGRVLGLLDAGRQSASARSGGFTGHGRDLLRREPTSGARDARAAAIAASSIAVARCGTIRGIAEGGEMAIYKLKDEQLNPFHPRLAADGLYETEIEDLV